MKKIFNFGSCHPELILVDNGGLAGQQDGTDERFWAGNSWLDATSIWGGSVIKGDRKIGNPTAEKGSTTRSQQLFFRGAGRPASNAKLPQFGGIVVVANPLL
ncbi:MAG: hypothetical protein EBR82_88875 [Caulobacteraceae bacterium]|nr:hypothetical protein [Caulobacteraceae bacterium]